MVESLDRLPIIIGHSMGGLVVQRFLEERTLPGAVLLAPVPLGGTMRATARVLRRHPLAFLKTQLTLSLGPLVATERLSTDLFLPDDADEEDRSWLFQRLQSESYLAYIDMLIAVRARPQLIRTPVRVIVAERDRIFGLGEHRRLAAAYWIEPIVVPGTAHDLMLGPRWETAAAALEEAVAALS